MFAQLEFTRMLFVANKQLNFYLSSPEVLQKGFVEEAGIVLTVIFSEHRLATHFLSPNAHWER